MNSLKNELNILNRAKNVKYNKKTCTFSFISEIGATLWTGRLDTNEINTLGGIVELRKFINALESGKKKVSADKKTIGNLKIAILCCRDDK